LKSLVEANHDVLLVHLLTKSCVRAAVAEETRSKCDGIVIRRWKGLAADKQVSFSLLPVLDLSEAVYSALRPGGRYLLFLTYPTQEENSRRQFDGHHASYLAAALELDDMDRVHVLSPKAALSEEFGGTDVQALLDMLADQQLFQGTLSTHQRLSVDWILWPGLEGEGPKHLLRASQTVGKAREDRFAIVERVDHVPNPPWDPGGFGWGHDLLVVAISANRQVRAAFFPAYAERMCPDLPPPPGQPMGECVDFARQRLTIDLPDDPYIQKILIAQPKDAPQNHLPVLTVLAELAMPLPSTEN
jgi:hypothetical protein